MRQARCLRNERRRMRRIQEAEVAREREEYRSSWNVALRKARSNDSLQLQYWQANAFLIDGYTRHFHRCAATKHILRQAKTRCYTRDGFPKDRGLALKVVIENAAWGVETSRFDK